MRLLHARASVWCALKTVIGYALVFHRQVYPGFRETAASQPETSGPSPPFLHTHSSLLSVQLPSPLTYTIMCYASHSRILVISDDTKEAWFNCMYESLCHVFPEFGRQLLRTRSHVLLKLKHLSWNNHWLCSESLNCLNPLPIRCYFQLLLGELANRLTDNGLVSIVSSWTVVQAYIYIWWPNDFYVQYFAVENQYLTHWIEKHCNGEYWVSNVSLSFIIR